MSRTLLHTTAFTLGLAAICWVGIGYVGANPLALAVVAVIGAFYLMGALELRRFHQATATLAQAVAALTQAPSALGPWLESLHPSLRNAVRLRIEGERVGLPAPALTPYLAGLLVLLGMLGTFLGMVVTLNGTGLALESASDLQAIRSSLSAPVKGLGLAFGTSVAGVAASAMLGLVSALCRRDRLQAAQGLDTRIATSLRGFSLAQHREDSFKLMQRQAEAMPALVDSLRSMMATMERQSQVLDERLVAGQDRFHRQAEAAYTGLAASVERSLKESLTESARATGAAIKPLVETTMAGIARETATLHAGLASEAATLHARIASETTDLHAGLEQRVQRHLQGLTTHFETTTATVADHWQSALATHQRNADEAQVALQAAMAARDEQRLAAWTESLAAIATSLQREWQQAGAQTAVQQRQICDTLAQTSRDLSAQTEAHARKTIAEITRLVQAASDAPRAAAEVIGELRQKLSDSMVRDNAMLDERNRLLGTLGTVLDAVNQASGQQRAAIDALVSGSAQALERVGTQFAAQVDAGTGRLGDVATQVTSSAVEVASLGEAFSFGVQLFSQSNEKLGAQLQRIENALGKSLARSDEQLAYYVAQAREIIDLSTLSQQQILEDLQQLASRRAAAASEA